MRKIISIVCLSSILAMAQSAPQKKTSKTSRKPAATGSIVTPDKLQWGAPPPVFPAGAQMAVVQGDPSAKGIFVVRLKAPAGYKVMPHWHPSAEYVTVLSGDFQVGMGDKWDDGKMQTLPQHSFAAVPAHHNHYAGFKTDGEIQVSGMGPFQLTYVNPSDDPSKKK